MKVALPWPPSALLPNNVNRQHWTVTRKASAKYGTDCYYLAKSQGLRTINADSVLAAFTFYPPDNRRRDLDAMLSAVKHGIDKLALLIGIDDSLWSIRIERGEPRKPGEVIVQFQPMEQE